MVAFSSLVRIWENVGPFIPHVHFFSFLLEVEISLHAIIPLYMPGSVHSGAAS